MHAELIAALGGALEVSRIIEEKAGRSLTVQAVRNWKTRGIPWRWRNLLVATARERGVAVPAGFLEVA